MACGMRRPIQSQSQNKHQTPTQNRFPLAKKRSTDVVGGDLCLGFEVLGAMEYAEVRWMGRCG